jgi:hypothetical protein
MKKAAFIYTHPPGKCGIAAFTVDSIANSKLASDEGFDRIVFMLLSVMIKRRWMKYQRNFSRTVEMRRMVVPAKQLLLRDNFINTDEAGTCWSIL